MQPAIIGLLLTVMVTVRAQFAEDLGPVPPRPIIPGAIPVRAPSKVQPRRFPTASDLVPPQTTFKIRRPLAGRTGRIDNAAALAVQARPLPQAPLPQQQIDDDRPSISPRPVVEDPEEERPDAFLESSPGPFSNGAEPTDRPRPVQVRPAPRPSSPSPSPPVFRPERPAFVPAPDPDLDSPPPSRIQQSRTTAAARPSPVPVPIRQQQFSRQQPPAGGGGRQQQVSPHKQQSSVDQQFLQERARQNAQSAAPIRTRKPVAQVLRKYREDNEDGSITWGFENDDGSFKEETIGVDCVTRGKYGYVDPDGVRREYTYASGIPCDGRKAAADDDRGRVDYRDDGYVPAANGDADADADAVRPDKTVKNRARKPTAPPLYSD